jgi:hypothetical protein
LGRRRRYVLQDDDEEIRIASAQSPAILTVDVTYIYGGLLRNTCIRRDREVDIIYVEQTRGQLIHQIRQEARLEPSWKTFSKVSALLLSALLLVVDKLTKAS